MDDLERQEQLLREAMRELQESSTVTADTFFRLDKETSKLGKSIEKAEEAIDRFWRGPIGKTTKATGDLAKGFISSGQAARQNRESFESLNPVIQGAASALSAIPIVGDALGKTLSTVGTFVTAELQKSVEAFQNLGSVGGIGAEGVTGLRKSAELAGLSFDQLSNIVSKNGSSLAFVFGSTATGLQEIAKLTKAAEPFRGELLALGVGLSQQTEYFTDYLQVSQRLGRRQIRDERVLAASSASYVKNLTDLSRLTGMSADQAQAEIDAQMSNIRFRKAMSGLDGDIQEAGSNVGVVIAGIGKDPALTRGFQDLVAGYGTEAGRDFAIATGGVGEQVAAQLKAGAISEQQAVEQIRAALSRTYETLPAQVFGAGTPFDNVSLGMANLATATIDYEKALAQGKAAAEARDPATEGMVDAQLSLQRFAVEMDTFVNNQVFPRAVDVIGVLTDKLADLGGMVNQVASGNLTGNGGGYSIGDYNPFDPANWARAFGFQARADGGPVGAGNSYLVGEQGPEMFSPNQGGFITDTSATQEYIASRQAYAKKMIKELFSDPMRLQEGYETASGETISLVHDGEGGVKIAGAEGTTYYDTQGNFIKHVMPTYSEGLTNTLHAGGGQSTSYRAGGASITQNFDPTGKVTSQQGMYAAMGTKMYTDTDYTGTAGPKTTYSGVATVDGVTKQMGHGTLGPGDHKAGGGLETEKLTELFEKMTTYMQNIDANTRAGADTSKKMLRAAAS